MRRVPRQTHLGGAGATATKSLTLVDLERPRSWEPIYGGWAPAPRFPAHAGETVIFRLPDELLARVVEFAAHNPDFEPGDACEECPPGRWESKTYWDNECVQALSRVCRRLRRIAQPMLFRTLTFSEYSEVVPPSRKALRLHHALESNPTLRGYCR